MMMIIIIIPKTIVTKMIKIKMNKMIKINQMIKIKKMIKIIMIKTKMIKMEKVVNLIQIRVKKKIPEIWKKTS